VEISLGQREFQILHQEFSADNPVNYDGTHISLHCCISSSNVILLDVTAKELSAMKVITYITLIIFHRGDFHNMSH
jgi:hypothetical protein